MEVSMASAKGGQPSRFAVFMASGRGRALRIAFGVALIAAGLVAGWPAGAVVAAFAILPLASGTFNLCPIAPLWGGHFLGSRYCARDK